MHNGQRYFCRVGWGLVILATVQLWSTWTWAIQTPYANKPGAFVTNDGLYWDNLFATKFAGKPGKTVFIFDFCFSGSFVNDLANANSYIGTAADWDEYSLSCGKKAWGQEFMKASKTNDLHTSWTTATPLVLDQQLPQEGGNQGALNLGYAAGDRAIIFSAGGRADFWTDVDTAHDALVTRANNPWNENAIQALWDQGQQNGAMGATWVDGASTKTNLNAAIDAVYNDPNFTARNKLFIYINDHGANTDVIKSRHIGTRYDYEVDVSLWRGWTDQNPYGIWELCIATGDGDIANYSNWVDPKPSWQHEITTACPNLLGLLAIRFYGDRNNRTTWLVSGIDYPFGYDHHRPPMQTLWETITTDLTFNDYGIPNGTPWGEGSVVYDQMPSPAADPAQWPGWHNGGDGWVLAPATVPEPGTWILLITGCVGLLGYGRRRRRQAA